MTMLTIPRKTRAWSAGTSQSFGDLFDDGECLINRDRPLGKKVCKGRSVGHFHHESVDAGGLFKAVNLGGVWVVKCRQSRGIALKPCKFFGVLGEIRRERFDPHLSV